MKALMNKLMGIYRMGVFKRFVIIWSIFQVVLWGTFGIYYSLNTGAWKHLPSAEVAASDPDGLLMTFLYIIGNNLLLFMLIAFGNMFVRFAMVTPGILIILVQGVMIGAVAGTNSFEFPFTSVMEANIQYLKVGLWETTSYAMICAVTLTKSLNISETFPAKKWAETRKLKDIRFNIAEKSLLFFSVLILVISALIEAILVSS